MEVEKEKTPTDPSLKIKLPQLIRNRTRTDPASKSANGNGEQSTLEDSSKARKAETLRNYNS